MATEIAEWEKITPRALKPAIKHIRDVFDDSEWKWSQLTQKLCYSALQPHAVDPAALAPYREAFGTYRKTLGRVAVQQFDREIRLGTPPAIFKAYLDAFRCGLKVDGKRLFNETVQIGIRHAEALKTHPVDWAKAHLQILLHKQLRSVERWIKEACDGQNVVKTLESDEDFEEAVSWRNWRAPRLIIMHPSGNAAYVASDTWTREDELRTHQLLKNLAARFIQFLEIDLEEWTGNAHAACAKVDEPHEQANPIPPLHPKKRDLSKYLDSAKLTDRQRECISLHLEYGLKKSAIAQRLGINRKTLDEHLSAAAKKIEINSARVRAQKNAAKKKLSDIGGNE